jgi:hypothetical protein
MEDNLDEILNTKFMTATKFSMDIENLVKESKNQSYIDVIVEYCLINDIEIESVSKLISKPLKEKIKADAIRLNYMKKTSRGVLPF